LSCVTFSAIIVGVLCALEGAMLAGLTRIVIGLHLLFAFISLASAQGAVPESAGANHHVIRDSD
jgi:hypothetical protein